MPSTPEHVRWSLAYACPLRDGDDWQRPARTERQLRPLRAVGDAQRDGPRVDGSCVAAEMASGGKSSRLVLTTYSAIFLVSSNLTLPRCFRLVVLHQ